MPKNGKKSRALTENMVNPEVPLKGAIFPEWQSVAKVLSLYTQICTPNEHILFLSLCPPPSCCQSVKIYTRHFFQIDTPPSSTVNAHVPTEMRKLYENGHGPLGSPHGAQDL